MMKSKQMPLFLCLCVSVRPDWSGERGLSRTPVTTTQRTQLKIKLNIFRRNCDSAGARICSSQNLLNSRHGIAQLDNNHDD